MRTINFRIFILLIFSVLAITESYHCVKQSFDDLTSGNMKEKKLESTAQNSKDELIQAGLLKYAGVFGGPSDYAEIDESGRSKRVKRYGT